LCILTAGTAAVASRDVLSDRPRFKEARALIDNPDPVSERPCVERSDDEGPGWRSFLFRVRDSPTSEASSTWTVNTLLASCTCPAGIAAGKFGATTCMHLRLAHYVYACEKSFPSSSLPRDSLIPLVRLLGKSEAAQLFESCSTPFFVKPIAAQAVKVRVPKQ
jgi:hypothetical protein